MVADEALSVQGALLRWGNDSGRAALGMRTAGAFTACVRDWRVPRSRGDESQLLPGASVRCVPVPLVVVHGHVGATRGARVVVVAAEDHLGQLVRDLDTPLVRDTSAP